MKKRVSEKGVVKDCVGAVLASQSCCLLRQLFQQWAPSKIPWQKGLAGTTKQRATVFPDAVKSAKVLDGR
jgi:hypothetical protein